MIKKTINAWLVTVLMISIFLAACNSSVDKEKSKSREEKLKEIIKAEDASIEFYGKVIDQHGDPVQDAQVTIQLSYFNPMVAFYFRGVKDLLVQTDKKGLFELINVTGDGILITKVEKKGYEFLGNKVERNYHYSAGSQKKHHPEKSNPVIFQMRKKEPPTLVFTHGLHFELNQNNKYEQAIDVVRGNWGALGQVGKAAYYGDEHEDVSIQAVLSEDKNAFTVSFTSTDQGGGILEREELLYVVPESGYEAVHTIQMPVNSNLKKYLYFKGRQGGVFARIDLELQSGTNGVGVHMTTWTNPKGGRSVDYYPEIEAEEDRRIYNEKK